MVITNRLKEDSFGYQEKLGTMEDRKDEILDLLELSKWCKNLKEQIAYDADILYYLEVEPKTSLVCCTDDIYKICLKMDSNARQDSDGDAVASSRNLNDAVGFRFK